MLQFNQLKIQSFINQVCHIPDISTILTSRDHKDHGKLIYDIFIIKFQNYMINIYI